MTIKYTPEQQAFIDEVQSTSQSIRLDAVAGSGKTTTLLEAAKAINPSDKTIALAFNKRIAEDLQEKFPRHVACKTFNGLGHAVWGKKAGRVKLDSRKMGEITSEYCKERDLGPMWHTILALASQLKTSGIIHPELEDRAKFPGTEATRENIFSLAIHHDLACNDEIAHAALDILLRSVQEATVKRMDFDDQIYMTTYFTSDKFWPKFDNILVDEAQDLSTMQHDMLERMMKKGTRLIIVGDPHQAIYGWLGASSDSMDLLQDRFSLKKMPLSVCFRCPRTVVLLAQHEVPHIQPREDAPEGIVKHIKDFKEEDLEEGSVVLCRNNAPLFSLAFSLISKGIPAYFSGRDMGRTLKKIVDSLGEGQLARALIAWRDEGITKAEAKEQYDKMDRIEDQYNTLEVIRNCAEAKDKRQLKTAIDHLFRKEYSPDAIELSTIHRAKGKEWKTVYFLNQHLIPGRWIKKAFDEGKECTLWMLQQEENLKYVAKTRALEKLYFINREKRTNEGGNEDG